ncbi:metallophosphoesterase [Deinococcus aquaticus]|uniref:metallophosphoesterase n=1 Tax=Deinococcus aquaticus TaxID=328692 RepID=UPI003F485643
MSAPPALTELTVPALSLVVLIGAHGAGKSTLAARHFAPEEVFAQADYPDVPSLLAAAGERLAAGRLAVLDGLFVRPVDRVPVTALARAHDVKPVPVVLDLPRAVLEARTPAPADVVAAQVAELRRTRRGLHAEGFRNEQVLFSDDQAGTLPLRRTPLRGDRRDLTGPFDVIGDVHGCLPELRDLLRDLGYVLSGGGARHPQGRTAVFVGDLVDRGPDSLGVLNLVMGMVAGGAALCVPGNHDEKLCRALAGKAVKAMHGLDVTLAQLEQAGPDVQAQVRTFIDALPTQLVLDGGALIVAHAGLPAHYHGRGGGRVRSFALYGDVNGQRDELGLPIRRDWAADYHGAALVVYGHTPHAAPRWKGNTVNVDTGCAFGGHLSALRYPERTTLSVPARAVYAPPPRPLPVPEAESGSQAADSG